VGEFAIELQSGAVYGVAIVLAALVGILLYKRHMRVHVNLRQGQARTAGAITGEVQPVTMAMPAIRTCKKCNGANPWTTESCTQCGEPLDKLTCRDCGRKCAPGKPTCMYCGGQLES
jgi:hypothetical protein